MERKRSYLNPQLRKHYEDRVKNDERMLEARKNSLFSTERGIDPAPVKRRVRKHKKLLEERTAPKVKTNDKNKAWLRFKELKEELKDELMYKNEMHPLKTLNGVIVADMNKARSNAYDLVKRMESGQDKKIREYRDLARLLEPDDPNIGNVESLRR